MSAADDLRSKAASLLVSAVELDRIGNANDAFRKYTEGVGLLVEFVKTLPLGAGRDQVNKQIASYLERAEQLKNIIKPEVQRMEQRQISEDSVGHGYDIIFQRCLDEKLSSVVVQDAYVSAHHQIMNFLRFCELVVEKSPNIKLISLRTKPVEETRQCLDVKGAFMEIAESLAKRGVKLNVEYVPNLHDREIKFDNGWIVKIGRGLDYFKRPVGKYCLGAAGNQNLRPCLQTTVDILKVAK